MEKLLPSPFSLSSRSWTCPSPGGKPCGAPAEPLLLPSLHSPPMLLCVLLGTAFFREGPGSMASNSPLSKRGQHGTSLWAPWMPRGAVNPPDTAKPRTPRGPSSLRPEAARSHSLHLASPATPLSHLMTVVWLPVATGHPLIPATSEPSSQACALLDFLSACWLLPSSACPELGLSEVSSSGCPTCVSPHPHPHPHRLLGGRGEARLVSVAS